MTEYLEFKVDKFTFRVATDRWYNAEGVWARWDGTHVQIGISDYLQQRSGDVAFVELNSNGAQVKVGEEVAVIETIKVNISLTSPATGKISAVNVALADSPELINQDPYDKGWMLVLDGVDWDSAVRNLYTAQEYFSKIKAEAEQETNPE